MPEHADEEPPAVTSQETCPGRVVFTEEGNDDGWIATDLTVDLRR
jgi:hypothetical protein